MGIAIVAMHYTGMAAAQFPLGSICGAARVGLNTESLALPIIVVTIAVLAVALITSVLDMRAGNQDRRAFDVACRGEPGTVVSRACTTT